MNVLVIGAAAIVSTWLRGSTADKAAMEAVVRASGIAFVIVRPAMVVDLDATGSVKIFEEHSTAHKITRADVAQSCVDPLTSDACVGRAVAIANSQVEAVEEQAEIPSGSNMNCKLLATLVLLGCAFISGTPMLAAAQQEQARAGDVAARSTRKFDHRYHLDRSYPKRGLVTAALPAGSVAVDCRSGSSFFHAGAWFKPDGTRFVVITPPLAEKVERGTTPVQRDAHLATTDLATARQPDGDLIGRCGDPQGTPIAPCAHSAKTDTWQPGV